MDPSAAEQILILVDDLGNTAGYAPRAVCHDGDGKRHAAVAVVLFNAAGDLLLQRRRSSLWDGFWDITGATHPLHRTAGDESFDEAARRCLRTEWHVSPAIRRVFDFVYAERYGGFAENEYCAVFAGRHDGAIARDPAYAYDMRWTPLAAAQAEAGQAPDAFTPWARITLDRLAELGGPEALGHDPPAPPGRRGLTGSRTRS